MAALIHSHRCNIIGVASVPQRVQTLPHARHRLSRSVASSVLAGERSEGVNLTADGLRAELFANKIQYKDNIFEQLVIGFVCRKTAALLQGVSAPVRGTYEDFVAMGKVMSKRFNAVEQRLVSTMALMSMVPSFIVAFFKQLFRPSKITAELMAWWGVRLFAWLVGESEVRPTKVEVAPGKVEEQMTTVYVKRCRYLEASECVGMCVNLCKVPTQVFFTDTCSYPLTLNPNFDDLSCEMIFGQVPPPLEEDPALQQPCFAVHCNGEREKRGPDLLAQEELPLQQ